jgi:biofilm PGA synthesis N-glycosyltransferase PgaC
MLWLLLILLIPYIYLLLKIYLGLLKIKSFSPSGIPEIFISVIVACRNEENNLPGLLIDIASQDYNRDNFELIIIDDSSSDKTFTVASGFTGIRNFKVIRNNGKGKKQAIRTGVLASSGTLIITTDADCHPGKSWIRTISSFHSEKNPGMIICPVRLESAKGFSGRLQGLEYLSLQGVTAGTAINGDPVMCNGANLAYTRDIYNSHSGDLHDELASGDDVFLLHSIKKEPGIKIMWLESDEAMVTTRSSVTTGSFIKQRVRWISKAGTYKDIGTRVLAIVTFITIILMWFLLIAGLFNFDFLPVLLAAFLLKSIPDFLILINTTRRYGMNNLMRVFLPAQIIYPVYVVLVFFCYLSDKKRFEGISV